MKELMTGNEAIARGVYEAGTSFAAAYPGTPSTEILESLSSAQYKSALIAEWAPNEKVALESVIGFSWMGGRAFASMKQVGLNVAADPLFSLAYTGCNGGLVIVTADEPGIHSSQTEQDNRLYADLAKVPMMEPSDSQECKDMVIVAMDISEKYRTPVLIRMTTRICHSKTMVELGERVEHPRRRYEKDIWQYTTMPAVSRKLRVELVERLEKLQAESETSPLNFEVDNGAEIGVITSGISYQYAKDAFGDSASYLKLGFTYPLPIEKIKGFAAKFKTLYVIEETEPYIEREVRAAGIICTGKDKLPCIGELSAVIIRDKLLGEHTETLTTQKRLAARPPVLCAGCPHRGVFYELGKQKNIVVSGDIGCYGLGTMPPFSSIDTVLCMGASVSGGHGVAKALKRFEPGKRAVSVIGDSTFFHSGMTGLLNNVYNKSSSLVIILDNRTTGMTGHQDHPGTGYTAQGDEAPEANIPAIVRALGVQQLRTIDPTNLAEVKDAIKWGLSLDEPAVIIVRWPCALKRGTQKDKDEFTINKKAFTIDPAACIGCKQCTKTGCPALRFDKVEKKASIYTPDCDGCGICSQTCPAGAISRG